MNQKLKILGMSTVSQPEIGSAYNRVNLRDKNGALVPVSPRKSILTLNEKYDYLFMHQMASFGVHYLGVRDSALYYIYHEATTTPYDLLLCTVGSNLQLSQIGNIVNITSSLGVKQLIWYNNSYVVIDTNFDGLQTDTTIGLCKVDLKVDGTIVNISSEDRILSRAYRSSTQFSYGSNAEANTDENRKIRSVVYDGLYSKALAGLRKDGIISGFTMATTAIELYDGSYILHSEPIVLGQAWDKFSRYNVTVNNTDYNYLDKKAVFVLSPPVLDNSTVNVDGYVYNVNKFSGLLAYEPNSFNEIFAASDIFPNFVGYYDKVEDNNNVGSRYLWLYALEQKLKVRISSVIQESFRPIVKSLSVFLSREVSIYKTESDKNYSFIANARRSSNGDVYNVIENYLPPVKTNAEIIKELADNQLFYKVHEIPFDDLKTVSDWITIDLKGKLGDSLINQEQLPIDNFTHHSIVPVKQYVYNSRLHLLNYDQILSHGFPLNYFKYQNGVGQFVGVDTTITATYMRWVETKIKTDSGNTIVVRGGLKTGASYNRFDLTPMLSYPDSRAFEMTVYDLESTTGENGYLHRKTVKLTASTQGNFAYYISSDLKPILFSETTTIVSGSFSLPIEINRAQKFQSGLKVSEVNNPFVFPAKNTYTIGNGRALNMSSNAMRVSEGQFGQYPLYVFTEDGVYALQIGTEVLYITQAPISTVQPISDKILSTPFGIFFITKKGLHIINGQEVALFSVMLEQKRDIITLSKIDYQTTFGAFMINNEELYSYLFSNDLKMVFNPHENEILLNKGSDKIFCANVEAPNWYLSTEKWDNVVENSFPDLLVKKDTQTVSTIIDYERAATEVVNSVEREVRTQCAFSLRGFDLGTDGYKKFRRAWIRGQIIKGTKIFAMLHGSIDNRNFDAVKGINITKKNTNTDIEADYKDIDLGLVGVNYKQFSLSLGMTCDSSTKISDIEIEIDKEYDNEKL